MTGKTDFTPEEWNTILESTMMAGIAVTAADPSGLWGLLQESAANTKAILDADRADGPSELSRTIGAELEASDKRRLVQDAIAEKLWGSTPSEVTAKALDVLRRASMIVEAKAPTDAQAFKAWLRSISQDIAEAATEGGFLGFGGIRVSQAEKATLAQIAAALGLAA
jgi:hypothetical protein